MIPQTASLTVPPDSSAQLLLRLGKPFVDFPRFSIIDLQRERDYEGNHVPFSEWLMKRLQLGQPFVIADFDRLDTWPKGDPKSGQAPSFGIERLIELSTKKNIPIRNCSTGRDLSFTLRKFADNAKQSFQEFQNLYARDLPCPSEWLEQCRKLLPTEVQWGGRLDLFQWLPSCARSEVMMAYVGSEGSSSGFHRCFSSTVALNLLVESDDRPVVCFGTDFDSQKKYDNFISARGASPHLDWYNLSTDEMLAADFPIYTYNQRVGDLVVFPPATAHQVWNPSTLSTKMVWNILHPLSLEVGFQYVQPPFNRLCHPDVARTNLSLACAMLSLAQDTANMSSPMPLPPDLPLLSRLFKQMVHDESIDSPLTSKITLVAIPPGVIATCNFCSTAIWNRHVRCTQCTDFDLCLPCYLNGRSCEHAQSYVWAELISPDQCSRVLNRAREILGFQSEETRMPDHSKTLGTAVNDLIRAKTSVISRLCHLCRIDHPEWKGRRCDKCTAFFCYRGLFRHFDMAPIEVIRHSAFWTCPKCSEKCNCRCCHFKTAYIRSEKPASKRRVKPSDPRGKVMGFADNVFDQKRGRRDSEIVGTSSSPSTSQTGGKKRSLITPNSGPATPLRKIEQPTPEPESMAHRLDIRYSHEGSDFVSNSMYMQANSSRSAMLPGLKSVTDGPNFAISPTDDRSSRVSSSPGIGSFGPPVSASNRITHHGLALDRNHNTLAPMLGQVTSSGQPQPLHHYQQQQQYTNVLLKRTSSTGPGVSPTTLTASPTMSLLNDSFKNQVDTKSPTAMLDASIADLENQVHTLRKYEEEFIELNLDDSRKMLSRQVAELEEKIKAKKREKSLLLIERLKREGFGGLAAVVGKEVGLGD